ncbi:MAG: SNF2-related protein [Myxococcota bacterium]
MVLLIADNEIVLDWAPSPDRARAVASLELPAARIALQPHQLVALRTLQDLWRRGEPGGLLCDDMGLGKTLQALVFAAWVAQQPRARAVDLPVVVVAPPALLEGWLRELEARLAPEVLPTVLWGPADRPSRAPARRLLPLQDYLVDGRGRGVTLERARIDRAKLAEDAPDVLLASYDQLRRLQFALGRLRIGVLVADEAHWAKDPNSLRSRALRAMNADFAVALTGMPIENGWRDLWTLCDFAVPGRLGTLRDFQEAYPGSGDVRELGTRLADTLAPVLVRRTRRDILERLPRAPSPGTRRRCPRPSASPTTPSGCATASRAARRWPCCSASRRSASTRANAPTSPPPPTPTPGPPSPPAPPACGARSRGSRERTLPCSCSCGRSRRRRRCSARSRCGSAARRACSTGRRRCRSATRSCAGWRARRGSGCCLCRPTWAASGGTCSSRRAVLLERTWNPAKEAQMIARVHRLGQTAPVEVVTPLAVLAGRRSFDAVLDQLLQDKRTLSESVLAPAEVSDEEVQARFRELTADAVDAGWAEVLPLVADVVRPLCEAAAAAGLPAPEPGFDYQHGKRVLATLELAWVAQRIAVVLPDDVDDAADEVLRAAGWTLLRWPITVDEIPLALG